MVGRGPRVEPSAAHRAAALETRALYLAFVETGFTDAEALDLAKTMITAGMSMQQTSGDT